MKKNLMVTTFVLICMIASLVMGMSAPLQAAAASLARQDAVPTIVSDAADYPPGGTVTLTGANWQGDTEVRIFVNDDVGNTWTRDVLVTVAGDGTIYDSFQLPNWFVATYRVVASGQQTGRNATTTFTDAPSIDRDFKQCAQNDAGFGLGNCHWINSILQKQNSRYFEGTSVPQRVIFPSLPPTGGNAHELLFFHEFTKGGVHAYDFLTSYAQAQATSLAIGGFPLTLNECGEEIPGPNPIDYAAICNSVHTTGFFIDVDVPDDPFVSGSFTFGDGDVQDRINAYEAQYGNRTIRIWGNAPFTSGSLTLAHDVANGGDTGDSDITYVLNWVSASTQIVIEMAGHLSVSVDGTSASWGSLKGAGAIPGGPYHFKLTEVDNTTLGQEDNQITSGDIVSPARKEGTKFNDLNGNGLNDGEPGLEGWEIQIFRDTDGNGLLSASEFSAGPYLTDTTASNGSYGVQIELSSPPEKFIVCEVAQSGWTQTHPANTICQAGTGLAPGGWAITLSEGQLDSGNDFGNRELNASIDVTKSGPETSKEGDPVTYTVTISNTGEVTLYKQSIIDSLVGNLTDGTNPAITSSDCGASLAVGATCTIVYTYTVQAGDPDPLMNTVTAVYDTMSDLTGDEATDSASFEVDLFYPSVDVEKTGDELGKVGDPVDYTITVNNTSSPDSPSLVNGTIVDSLLGNLLDPANPYVTASTCTTTLATGASCTISATRTVQAGDPDPLPNTVTVHYKPQGFPNDITDNDSHSVELFTPSVDIDKTGDALSKVGDDVAYTITVTNTSSPDSPNLTCTITDAMLGIDKDVNLAPGEEDVTNASYTVQPNDPDPLVNTASVNCTVDGFGNEVSDSDGHEVNLFTPSVDVEKTGDELGKVGDPVDYTITVNNTSSPDSPSLVNGTIVDSLLGNLLDPANPYVTASTCTTTLATGASCTITATRTVQAGDPDPLPNTVTVHYKPQGFPNDITDNDSHSVELFQPAIELTKTGDALSKIGDDVTYTITLHNNSSPDTPDLVCTISDPGIGFARNVTLASGASDPNVVPFTIPAGADDPFVNTAYVTCSPEGFPNIYNDSASHSVNLFQPSVRVVKAGDTLSKVDDPVTYTFIVTNTSSADSPALVLDTINDTLLGNLAAPANLAGCGNLTPGASCNFSFTRTVQAGDPDPLPNTVTVHYHPDGFTNDITDNDSHSVNLFQPSIEVAKTGPAFTKEGDTNTYTVTVTNTSSTDTPELVSGTLVDSLAGNLLDPANTAVLSSDCDGSLDDGESCTVTYTYVTQGTDLDPLVNTVVAHFNPDGFPNDITDSARHSSDVLHPDFTVTKSCKAEPISQAGPAVFTITFNNTGDADLHVVPSEGAPFDVAAGGSFSYDHSIAGPFDATVSNTVTGTVTLDGRYGLSNSYTFEASDACDVKGKVRVVKTVSGQPPAADQSFTFELRQGASTIADGTVLETRTTDASGNISFSTELNPGQTYQLCEWVFPGWNTNLSGDGPMFVPGSIIPPALPNPNVNNLTVCVDFSVTSGQTRTFTVDNSPPPGGRALTIGFWKNWASCASSSGRGQDPMLDLALGIASAMTTNPPGGLVVSAQNAGSGWPNYAPLFYLVLKGNPASTEDNILNAADCAKAVALLDKRNISNNRKMASDPIFNMTAQLVAAQLNRFMGAGISGVTITNIDKAVLLNGKYKFNGSSYTPRLTAADAALANCLATQLDNYNNNLAVSACP